jgi:GTP diphosphokinase / guanosine-3',5'-bis(diphosphate) 3'-diphosphatase
MFDPELAPSLPFSELEPEAPRYGIADLCGELAGYLPAEEVREVYRAYLVGAEAHQDQKRKSGLPYISHPVAVARILGKMHMDSRCLMAAMLHDVLEDTAMPKAAIAESFGDEVAELVDGVTKLTQMDFQNKQEAQAENFRKMMLAMTKDIRVILIKLADRLHNMHTLGAMKREAQRRIACETLDIYAPIANRLGINKIRLDLEELGFSYAWPMRFRALMNAVRTVHQNHRELIDNVETVLRGRLEQEGLNGRVQGREKHLYSIYRKMREKHVAFSEVVDVFAFRIIVDRVDTCYRVLGAVHNLYKPKPGGFKDYIAIPKSNGYQSLHTVLVGPQGIPVEIQIRTREMDWMAEFGVASHWFYKEGKPDGSPIQKYANDWVRNLLELQKGAGNSIEFLEHVKVDLFPDEVYVFTPRGEIKVLAKGATVIDFAYGVHSDVGNYCVAALVDRRWVPLRTRIHSGQTVEIITKEGGRPDPAWLDFVVTAKARSHIRTFLKGLHQQEAVTLGRRLLGRALEPRGLSLETLEPARLEQVLKAFKSNDLDELLEQIGLGNRMPALVAKQFAECDGGQPMEGTPLVIRGTEGMVVKLSKCCRPIPGDAISAFFRPGQGVVVHRQECRNGRDARRPDEEFLEVRWEGQPQGEFTSELSIAVGNKRGVLATVAAAIAAMESNIENLAMEERDGLNTTLRFVVTVRDRRHLAGIMRRLRALPQVLKITRLIG